LDIFATENVIERNRATAAYLGRRARDLANHPHVTEVRPMRNDRCNRTCQGQAKREPYPWTERRGPPDLRHALKEGVLLRPIGDVVYFMPPYTVSESEMDIMLRVAAEGIELATCD